MATSAVHHRGGTSAADSSSSSNPMGTRKTLIIMVTVVGCIAILWPKVFYPMVVGPNGGGGAGVGVGGQFKPNIMKDHRGSGCCDVVLDQEKFANASINAANQHDLFRKRNVGPAVEDGSIRQERPPHLRPETIHPAMRERGRAIPHVGSVHSERPVTPPRIVEGRPGPIPGMRPPMGAGSHQSTKSVNSMGFIMPLYTIGIVSFFIYTILKLLFKKNPATPYPEIKPDTTFREEVFTQDQYIKRPVESGKTKLDTKIEPAIAQTTTQQSEPSTTSSSGSSSSRSSTATVISTLEQRSSTPSSSEAKTTPTIIDQVPTSASNVTNPKFLTLNLVNYSLSESSGNNSNSSASASAFKTLEVVAAAPAGTADVSAAVETAETSGQLMELDLLRRKLDETEQAMTKIIANMGCIPKGQSSRQFKV